MIRNVCTRVNALIPQLIWCESGCKTLSEKGFTDCAIRDFPGGKNDGQFFVPSVSGQEVGDTAYGVNGRIFKIGFPVTVEIDSILPYAPGHELRISYGSSIGAIVVHGIGSCFSGQKQKILEFPAKERFSCRLVCRFGIVERQCGKRIDCPVVSGVIAVNRFDSENADDDMGRHSVFFFSHVQIFFIFFPESDAGRYSCRFDHSPAVCLPVFQFLCPGRCYKPDNSRIRLDLAEEVIQFCFVKVMFFGNFTDEIRD